MTARSLLLLVLPLALAACSSDTFTPADDAGSGSDAGVDGAADDGSASDGVAPHPDAGADALPPDAGWSPPPPLVCANAPADAIFCADFDTSNEPGSGWSSIFKLNGDVTLDLTNFYSSARSARTVANGNPQSYGTLYQNNLDATHAHFALTFAFRVEDVDTAALVRVGRFSYPSATVSGNVNFDVVIGSSSDVGLSISAPTGDAGLATSNVKLGSYTKGAWHHVVLTVQVKPAVSVMASFDGATQAFSPSIPVAGNVLTTRDINLGAHADTNMASAATIQIDDVLLRAF